MSAVQNIVFGDVANFHLAETPHPSVSWERNQFHEAL